MKRALAVTTLAVAGAVTAFTGLSGHAGAQTALVTDYAAYPDTPQAQLPAGCDGGGLFHSEVYSLNGGPAVSDPKSLPELDEGDVITMSWTATTPECVGAPIVLDIKVSQKPTFDPGDDQVAYVPYAVATADGGPGSLSFTMPDLVSVNAAGIGRNCAYQFDSIVGLPLAIVGPNGSDYSASVRGDDKRTTLIGYRNGAYENCTPPETTTSTTVPGSTTTTAPEVTTTTAPPEVTTTQPEATPTTEPVVVTTQPQTLTVAHPAEPAPAVAQTRPPLATTGGHGPAGPIAAVLFLAAGTGLVLATRNHQRRKATR